MRTPRSTSCGPILLDHGMQATFYANSGLVDLDNGAEMTWDQLRGLAADGNDVGGHTLTHADLSRLSLPAVQHEICADRDRLITQELNPVSFAYPFGNAGHDIEQIVRSCGYRSAAFGRRRHPVRPDLQRNDSSWRLRTRPSPSAG